MRRVGRVSNYEEGVEGGEDEEVMVERRGCRMRGSWKRKRRGLESLEGVGESTGTLLDNTFEVVDLDFELFVAWERKRRYCFL